MTSTQAEGLLRAVTGSHPQAVNDLRKHIAILEADLAAAREALKPFAKCYETFGVDGYEMGDTRDLWVVWGSPSKSSFTLGDLRRAALSVKETKKG